MMLESGGKVMEDTPTPYEELKLPAVSVQLCDAVGL
jgi:hypothetical protein